jgi:hypothetical protein
MSDKIFMTHKRSREYTNSSACTKDLLHIITTVKKKKMKSKHRVKFIKKKKSNLNNFEFSSPTTKESVDIDIDKNKIDSDSYKKTIICDSFDEVGKSGLSVTDIAIDIDNDNATKINEYTNNVKNIYNFFKIDLSSEKLKQFSNEDMLNKMRKSLKKCVESDSNGNAHGGGLIIPDRSMEINIESAAKVCSICFESPEFNEKFHLRCGHLFHKTCITKWLSLSNKCPNCKQNDTFNIDVVRFLSYNPFNNEDEEIPFHDDLGYESEDFFDVNLAFPARSPRNLIINNAGGNGRDELESETMRKCGTYIMLLMCFIVCMFKMWIIVKNFPV